MPSTYPGNRRLRNAVTVHSDGDAADAAHFNPPHQQTMDALTALVELQANFRVVRAKATSANFTGISYGRYASGDEYWVAVGEADGGDALLVVSVSGEYWQEVANPKNGDLNGVCFDATLGMWVAVGSVESGDAYIATATTPTGTWTERSNPAAADLWSVASNGAGVFVAVGSPIGGQSYILRSTDGLTWAQQAAPINDLLRDITFGNGLFVAVGGTGATARILTSTDGITWTERSHSATDDPDCVCWNGSVFLTLSSDTAEVMYSSDGTSWATRSSPGILRPAGGTYQIAADPETGLVIASNLKELFVSVDDGVSFRNMGPYDRLDAFGTLGLWGLYCGAGRWMGIGTLGHVLRGLRS